MAALNDNPPLKTFNGRFVDRDGEWWIAKVKPRQEKALAFDLEESGIDFCMPMVEKKMKKNGGGYRKSMLVLFPSYVPFISDSPYELLKSSRVSTIIKVPSQSRFKMELDQVYSYLYKSDIYSGEISLLPKIGDDVHIISGTFNGFHGDVAKIGSKNKIYLNVNGLGTVIVSIEDYSVKKQWVS